MYRHLLHFALCFRANMPGTLESKPEYPFVITPGTFCIAYVSRPTRVILQQFPNFSRYSHDH